MGGWLEGGVNPRRIYGHPARLAQSHQGPSEDDRRLIAKSLTMKDFGPILERLAGIQRSMASWRKEWSQSDPADKWQAELKIAEKLEEHRELQNILDFYHYRD